MTQDLLRPQLSVITVTWNSAAFIARQIASVQAAAVGLSYEHIIVDNASTDGTVEIIRRSGAAVRLLENTTNAGFAAPNNQAAAQARGTFFLFLNPDMELQPGSLRSWVMWMQERADTGVSGCKLVTPDEQMRLIHKPTRFPTLTSLTLTALKLSVLFPNFFARYSYTDAELQQDADVDVVRGSCLMLRRELYDKLGFAFDPRYFIWFEDVDLCREAQRSGYRVVFTPHISAIDYAGQSFKQQPLTERQRRFFTSAEIYLKKWRPRYQAYFLRIAAAIGYVPVWLYERLRIVPFFPRLKDAIER